MDVYVSQCTTKTDRKYIFGRLEERRSESGETEEIPVSGVRGDYKITGGGLGGGEGGLGRGGGLGMDAKRPRLLT